MPAARGVQGEREGEAPGEETRDEAHRAERMPEHNNGKGKVGQWDVTTSNVVLTVGKTRPRANQAKWKLSCIAGLVLLFLSVEVAGGIRSGSLAILTDAAHLLTDAIGIFISLFALMMSAKKPTKTMSYGYHRLEILGALISVLLIWAVTGVLVVEATMRIMQPVDVDGKLMLLVASFGIFMNVIMVCILHGTEMVASNHSCCHAHGHHTTNPSGYEVVQDLVCEGSPLIGSKDGCCHHGHHHGHGDNGPDRSMVEGNAHAASQDANLPESNRNKHTIAKNARDALSHAHSLGTEKTKSAHSEYKVLDIDAGGVPMPAKPTNVNVRSAYLHVLGDLIQSTGVAVAGLTIYFHPGWRILDPICTYVFSTMVLLTTRKLFCDVTGVLLERTPDTVNPAQIRRSISAEAGVHEVVDLHIWSITFDQVALTARLAVCESANKEGLLGRVKQRCRDFGIHHTTLEMFG